MPRVSQVALVKKLPANAGDARDTGLIPGSGRSPGVGNGNLIQYSCLENPVDKGAWQATVHGVTKSRTQLSTHKIGAIIGSKPDKDFVFMELIFKLNETDNI